jgi:hypothetical protein
MLQMLHTLNIYYIKNFFLFALFNDRNIKFIGLLVYLQYILKVYTSFVITPHIYIYNIISYHSTNMCLA